MMRAAIVVNGVVVNVILVEPEYLDHFGAIPCPDDVCPGWSHDGETFTPPVKDAE